MTLTTKPAKRKPGRTRTQTSGKRIADRLWSLAVRSVGKCERCEKTHGVLLAAHHAVKRSFFCTRFDVRNGVSLCGPCHRWVHLNPADGREFITSLFGADLLLELERQAQDKFDWDYDRVINTLRGRGKPNTEEPSDRAPAPRTVNRGSQTGKETSP